MRQAERIQQRVHVFHADAVDDDIGSGIVAHGNHQRGDIANGEPRHARGERAGDAAPAHEIGRLQRVEVAELDLALLRLAIKFRENNNLYRTGRGKHFVGVKKIFLPRGEIKDGDAKDAVKIAVHAGDRRFQLLPQNLFFLLRSFLLRTLLRESRRWGPNHDAEQSK